MGERSFIRDEQGACHRKGRFVRSFLMVGFLVVLAVEAWLLIQIALILP